MRPMRWKFPFKSPDAAYLIAKVCIFIKTRACRKGFFAITCTKTGIIMIIGTLLTHFSLIDIVTQKLYRLSAGNIHPFDG